MNMAKENTKTKYRPDREWKMKNPDKYKEMVSKLRAENPNVIKGWWKKNNRERYLVEKYGLTASNWQKMFERQYGRCAICGIDHKDTDRGLFVDHNHSTGKVRGLICINCNLVIGNSRENCAYLIHTIEYLRTRE